MMIGAPHPPASDERPFLALQLRADGWILMTERQSGLVAVSINCLMSFSPGPQRKSHWSVSAVFN